MTEQGITEQGVTDVLEQLLIAHSPELRDGSASVSPQARLVDLGIDSLELLSLAADIEDAFRIDIDDSDLDTAKTVADLARIVDAASGTGPA
ncbi:acyl carrier protein [Streptomyces sp. col6]|uniref:acyl carrier protein n=1 Tax=Streptomyces sp. col6 TaxID=2478958 RepID=UPI0011CD7494|nr:phosphopantetheine-binding protein [Streptomyces sp. col6]TXR92355.1 acyl carrier protein [Streptomyces sp. col6]